MNPEKKSYFEGAGNAHPEAVKARRGDVQLDSGWVHIRGTKRAARDRHILVRHPALASLLGYALKHAPGEDLLFPPCW